MEPTKLLVAIFTLLVLVAHSAAETHFLFWNVETTNITHNCFSANVTTVNGQIPGPTVEINEGDTVVINVTNNANYEISIHWHGIFQFLTNWADGPAHITQCPLNIGSSQIYEFTVTGQSGTFFWHAHNNWLRATMYGHFIVHPAAAPPFGEVAAEYSIISGEWFSQDPNVVELGFIDTLNPVENATVANTINGEPGPLYGCPADTQIFPVTSGSTYLLRLTNAGLNNDHFFKVANHTLTVVRADGNYLQPFDTDVVVITPGQTTDVLLTANQPIGSYYGGVNVAEVPNVGAPPPSTPALVIIQYEGSNSTDSPVTPEFPSMFNLMPVDNYTSFLKGLEPYSLPETVDVELVYVAGIASVNCNASEPCTTKIAGTIQNSTFDDPQNTSVLEAYYNNIPGVFTTDVPDLPPVFEDFTSQPDRNYILGNRGTRTRVLQFNDVVQLVLQNVNAFGILDHPFHLHGHDFYVVGRNYTNFNPDVDPAGFNLVDPPKFNTISIPNGGWVALRFQANNPGVWLLHCHFERHKTWGMEMAFITENGSGANETLPGPLHPPPSCT
ncbi:hypothetical protein KC19_2G252500 [Ceratodon purpureus]|uniref:Laccase n=1 Tax=Ceratodon purpureus TaxID=3225 RepID=A0A8T0J1J4_CERPU|nr:hypothetical protein KC19_2G252500 [Ceratodon purpureus]